MYIAYACIPKILQLLFFWWNHWNGSIYIYVIQFTLGCKPTLTLTCDISCYAWHYSYPLYITCTYHILSTYIKLVHFKIMYAHTCMQVKVLYCHLISPYKWRSHNRMISIFIDIHIPIAFLNDLYVYMYMHCRCQLLELFMFHILLVTTIIYHCTCIYCIHWKP